jgi:hypothetical protein
MFELLIQRGLGGDVVVAIERQHPYAGAALRLDSAFCATRRVRRSLTSLAAKVVRRDRRIDLRSYEAHLPHVLS